MRLKSEKQAGRKPWELVLKEISGIYGNITIRVLGDKLISKIIDGYVRIREDIFELVKEGPSKGIIKVRRVGDLIFIGDNIDGEITNYRFNDIEGKYLVNIRRVLKGENYFAYSYDIENEVIVGIPFKVVIEYPDLEKLKRDYEEFCKSKGDGYKIDFEE